MKYKSVIFDLDGTLLDTALDIMSACNYTLAKFGFNELDEEVLRTKVTAGMREMMKLSVPEEQWESAGVETVMRDCFANYYTEHICDKTVPFEGISEVIEKLHEKGIKTAVVTNKYYNMAVKVLSKFTFSQKFELILGCDSLTHSKPHPEPILKACSLLDVSPNESLYVGDHLNDILAANAAQCDSVIALWGYGMKECPDINTWNAKFRAKDVTELQRLIF